jgi:hypothetical protein
MQDKDIKEKLNQELDKMAPDILNRILAEPIEPVKSEKELFGKNKPLFKKQKNMRKYIFAPAMVMVAACAAILVMIFNPYIVQQIQNSPEKVAFNITIDVNPSITIDVNESGTVEKVKAANKDAKKIVKQVNKQITEDTDYNKAVKMVVKELGKNGYLKKEKNAMLISVISDDKKTGKKELKEIKKETDKVKKKAGINGSVVYQVCEQDEKAVKIAEKNNVSVGKATLCMKLAAKENGNVDTMCKKSIDTLVEKAEQTGMASVDNEIISYIEPEEIETEDVTLETEIFTETESIEENSYEEEETTLFEEEPESEPDSLQEDLPETEDIEENINE